MIWQPIETAPKDGTSVLLWASWLDDPVIARYSYQSGYAESCWEGTFDGAAALESQGDTWTDEHEVINPTHWMPLPDPPKESEDD